MLFWEHDNCVDIYSTSVLVCVCVCVCALPCITQPTLSLVQPDMEAAIWRGSMSDIKWASALILHGISLQALSLQYIPHLFRYLMHYCSPLELVKFRIVIQNQLTIFFFFFYINMFLCN